METAVVRQQNEKRKAVFTGPTVTTRQALVRRDGRNQRRNCHHNKTNRTPSHLHRTHLIDQPFCDCDVISHADQQHTILCCPNHKQFRENLYGAIDKSGIP